MLDILTSLTEQLFTIVELVINSTGYFGIFFFMAIESSFIPFPSEIIIPPASYIANRDGVLNVYMIAISGILGSIAGAYFNYYFASTLTKIALHNKNRFVQMIINEKNVNKSHDFFEKYGDITVFTGRLLPVIRQLISLPAGVAKMGLAKFTIYTTLGSSIWCAILAYVGWTVGDNQEAIKQMIHQDYYWVLGFLVIVVGLYMLNLYRKKAKINNDKNDSDTI